MNIEEYKKKFLELFKQLEDEHGPIREVEILERRNSTEPHEGRN